MNLPRLAPLLLLLCQTGLGAETNTLQSILFKGWRFSPTWFLSDSTPGLEVRKKLEFPTRNEVGEDWFQSNLALAAKAKVGWEEAKGERANASLNYRIASGNRFFCQPALCGLYSKVGVESAPVADEPGRSWEFYNADAGFGVFTDLPATDDLAVALANAVFRRDPTGKHPMRCALDGGYYEDMGVEANPSQARVSAAVDWPLELTSLGRIDLGLWPKFTRHWTEKTGAFSRFEGEIVLSTQRPGWFKFKPLFWFPCWKAAQEFEPLKGAEPSFTARYVNGHEAPKFEKESGWEFVLASKWDF